MLTKDEILAADDAQLEKVHVPEWGDDVFIRALPSDERAMFENQQQTQNGRINMVNIYARYAVLILCDEKGARLFTDAEAGKLGRKSGAAIGRVFKAGIRLNAMSEDDVKEMVGNSDSGPSSDSGSN